MKEGYTLDNLETAAEKGFRPQMLADFVGQEQLKDNLSIFIDASKKVGHPLDHVLFSGPPGLGKTSMAQIIARELGTNFVSSSGPLLTKAADIASIITNLSEGDVFFIDEIHRLPISVEEVLYPAMEDFKLDLTIGEGPSARSVSINIANFTLIGATTRIGLLSKPMRERFGIPLNLSFYTPAELKKIMLNAIHKLKLSLDEEASLEIAKRSRGTPRIALRLLKRVADFTHHKNSNTINLEIAREALHKLQIDKHGLDSNDYRYLKFIADKYEGGPVGIETISAALSEQKDSIEETVEPYMIQQGLVHKTPRGRVLTPLAFEYIKSYPCD